MKFGVCADIEQAQTAYQAGYDYIECTVQSLQPEKKGPEIQSIFDAFNASPLPIEAFNIFIPSDLKVTGDQVNYDRIHQFLDIALPRVNKVGGETIVFGSGGARTLSKGFSKEKGEEQLIKFLNIVADYAEPLGITIVIEPLYKKASNLINTVPEAVHLAQQVNRKSIKVLADFFHMMEEADDLEHIIKYKDFIRHIHTSDHYYPPGKGDYPYSQFVNCLRGANYNGRVSIECIWNDFEQEAVSSLMFIKKAFQVNG